MKIVALLVSAILLTWVIAVSENQAYACGLNAPCLEGEPIFYLHNPFSWIYQMGNYFSFG